MDDRHRGIMEEDPTGLDAVEKRREAGDGRAGNLPTLEVPSLENRGASETGRLAGRDPLRLERRPCGSLGSS